MTHAVQINLKQRINRTINNEHIHQKEFVMWLFHALPWVCLLFVIVVFFTLIKYFLNLLHIAFNSNSSHIRQDFIRWFKQVTDKFLCSSYSRFASLCLYKYRNRLLSFDFRLRIFEDFSISAGKFSITVAKKHRS